MAIKFTAADQAKNVPAAPAREPAPKADNVPATVEGIEAAAGTDLFDSAAGSKWGKRKRK